MNLLHFLLVCTLPLIATGYQRKNKLVSSRISSSIWNRIVARKIQNRNTLLAAAKSNSLTDIIPAKAFDHIEFYTIDALSTAQRFSASLGLDVIAKSDFSTGNNKHASYLLQSQDVKMIFTAPYNIYKEDLSASSSYTDQTPLRFHYEQSFPSFNATAVNKFIIEHGLAVRAIGITIESLHPQSNIVSAFNTMVERGARPALPPTRVFNTSNHHEYVDLAEVELYGDVVLRLIDRRNYPRDRFLPNFQMISSNSGNGRFGIQRIDHVVGNVWRLPAVKEYIQRITGFHEFAEFIAEDVGTEKTGLNSIVLANNAETILLPVNEPTESTSSSGSSMKSQILTYLEHNNGEGVQHIALFTKDIFRTLSEMVRTRRDLHCGFELLAPPPYTYYQNLEVRLSLKNLKLTELFTSEQWRLIQDLGILVDCESDDGILLQIFTKPLSDRNTIFLEIIQRIGCVDELTKQQKPGCGGFGKGNFKALFKSIEDYETSLGINQLQRGESSSL